MQTSRLHLQGLMCSGCSEIIERATKTLSGVSDCKVNLDTQQATIQYDPQYVSLETIQQALTAVGYVAQPIDKTPNLTA